MINMDKRVGVFMQLYRNEPSMHKAIVSVLNQTYSNFKFYVLVSHETYEVVENYAKRDERIVVIMGKAGESALNYDKYIAADGNDYFSVIDADDWYEDNYIETLINCAEQQHADIVAGGNSFINGNNQVVGVRQQMDIYWDVEKTGHILPYIYAFFRTMWGKIIKSEVILGYDPEGLPKTNVYGGYGGDTIYMFYMLLYAKRMGICNKTLYNYRLSPTGTTYDLREGRLDSDEYVFEYVKNIIERLGKLTDESEQFLYVVYAEALTDTTRLLISKKMTEEERIDKLVYIYTKKTTYNLFDRVNRNTLGVYATDNYINRLYNLIFNDITTKYVNENITSKYLEIYITLFEKWRAKINIEEFCVLLKEKQLIDDFTFERYQSLFSHLLLILKELNDIEDTACLNLLRRLSQSISLQTVFEEKNFVLMYSELLDSINKGQDEVAFQLLDGYFSENLPYNAEQLIDLWKNYAAERENADEYILAIEHEIETDFLNGRNEMAKCKFQELRSMGIDDENMNNLYLFLYEHKE